MDGGGGGGRKLTPHASGPLAACLDIPLHGHQPSGRTAGGEQQVGDLDGADIALVTDLDHDVWVLHVLEALARSHDLRPAGANNDGARGDL